MRKIIVSGYDGRSNPIYHFHDELEISSHMRTNPTIDQIVEQFPDAQYCTVDFQYVPLKTALG